eukprot:c12028_g1_i1.p1 GENE.c12028_g1_i1~~c12028_g1_i1.p1  ORF type:complete len:599 (-),score=189.94 c12028_g1_i1:167-1858(-)
MDVEVILGKRKRELEELGLGEFAKGNEAHIPKQAEDDDDDTQDRTINDVLNDMGNAKTLDANEIKMMVLQLEKKINRNQQLRMKYQDEPKKFVESEVDLHDQIGELQSVASVPELYPTLVRLGLVPHLLQLLSHENVDISVDVVDLLHELLDSDTVADNLDDCLPLVDALLDHNALELLVQNINRYNEATTEESTAVHNTLAVFEAMCDAKSEAVSEALCCKTNFLTFLIRKLTAKPFDQNKLYASEMLAIVSQSSRTCQEAVGQVSYKGYDGIDLMLQITHRYKRKDPSSVEEKEMVENVFDALCSCLLVRANRALFLKADGLDLMLIMIKERQFASSRALKALTYALNEDGSMCDKFVDKLGLKVLMPALVKSEKWAKRSQKKSEADEIEKADEEHIIASITSLLTYGQPLTQRRVLNKFCENGFEKLPRLVSLHCKYADFVAEHDTQRKEAIDQVGAGFFDSDNPELTEYSERLDAGLFTLQQIDLTIAYLITKCDSEAKKRLVATLNENGMSLEHIQTVLQGYADNMGEEVNDDTSSDQQLAPVLTKTAVLELVKKLGN